MKKILFSIATLAVAFGFTACSNEDEALSVKGEKTTVLAMTEASTRTALADDGEGAYNVVWSEGDEITIGDLPFTLKSGAGETAATFEGPALTDNTYKAFYGIVYNNGLDFGPTQYYEAGKVSNFPMYADTEVKDGKIAPLQFKNICGILRLTVKGTGTATIKSIKITANENVSGDLLFGTYKGEYGLFQGDPYLVIDCGSGIALTAEGTVFNIAMMPGTYTGVKITLTDTENNSCTKTFKGNDGLKIERSMITKAAFSATTFVGTTGTAKATIGGEETDVNWVQLWAGGPKFAEYNVADKMNFESAYQIGKNFAWGSNWRLPREDEFEELWHAVCYSEDTRNNSKVTCVFDRNSNCFIFTGKEEGFTDHSVTFPGMLNRFEMPTYSYYWAISTTNYYEAAYLGINNENDKWNSSQGRYRNDDTTMRNQMYYVRPVLNE